MQADPKQLFCLKALLHSFAESTGLKVNFHKSCLVPINVRAEKVPLLTGGPRMHSRQVAFPISRDSPWHNQAFGQRLCSPYMQSREKIISYLCLPLLRRLTPVDKLCHFNLTNILHVHFETSKDSY